MNRNISSEYGQIKIHNKVIREIAEITAGQIKGVQFVGWQCYGLWGEVLHYFGISLTKVSKVNLEKEIKIVIPITVKWGENAVNVAYTVQKEIITQILNSLNIDALSVDVKIKKVERGE